MITSATTSPTTAAAATQSSATAAVTDSTASQDRFLKLLVAQMNNQDPMNPMDNAQMTSQMAQINTVTGIQQVNDTLKNMATQFSAMQVLQGSSMVGHDVMLESSSLTVKDGAGGGAVDLAGKADSVKVEVVSPGGEVLDTFNLGALDTGRHFFSWDATNYQGTGNPSFKVTATLAGKAIETTTLARDTVVAIGSENGAMTMHLEGRSAVPYSSVKAIL